MTNARRLSIIRRVANLPTEPTERLGELNAIRDLIEREMGDAQSAIAFAEVERRKDRVALQTRSDGFF